MAKLKLTITMSLDGYVHNLDGSLSGYRSTGLVRSGAAAHYTYAVTPSENS